MIGELTQNLRAGCSEDNGAERNPPLIATQSASLTESTVTCPIAGIGTLHADADHLVKLRRQPGSYAGKAFSPAFLKHADDQTVAAVGVVAQTISKLGWDNRSFHDWGVVAAPILFGRFGNEAALRRFMNEGAWGISPHMIPHHSLHAVAGTLSQAWQIHGPNFGISGGPGATGARADGHRGAHRGGLGRALRGPPGGGRSSDARRRADRLRGGDGGCDPDRDGARRRCRAARR